MAIAEEYLLKFKGDTSDLNRKLNQTQGAVGGLMSKVGGLGKTIAGLGAALAAVAIFNKFKNVAIEMDNIADAAERIGVGVEQFSALNYAAEIADVSMQSLEVALRKMQVALYDAGNGSENFINAFATIGMNVEQLRQLSPEEQFIKIASAVAAIDEPAKRTAVAMDIFGRSGLGIVNMAKEGETALRGLTSEAREVGAAFDEEAAQKAAEFDKNLKVLENTLQGVFIALGDAGVIEFFSTVTSYATTAVSGAADSVRYLRNELVGLFEDPAIKEAEQKILKMGELIEQEKKKLGIPTGEEDPEITSNTKKPDAYKQIISGLEQERQIVEAQVKLYGEKDAVVERARKQIEITNKLQEEGRKLTEGETIALNEKLSAIEMQSLKYQELEDTQKALEKAEEDRQQNLRELGNVFESSFEDAIVSGGKLGDVFKSLGEDIARLLVRQTMVKPLVEGLGSAISGSGVGDFFGDLFSFDGGGYTGSGSRAGGLDGKGGFLSIMHPNETVIDHSKGQRMGGGGVTVVQNNNNQFTSDMDIDRRIKSHQPILVESTKRAVLQALQSGGEFSKVIGNRV